MKKVYDFIYFIFILDCNKEQHINEPKLNIDNENPIENFDFSKSEPLIISIPNYLGSECIVGNGTPESITIEAIKMALDNGGKIKFNFRNKPVTMYIDQTLKVTR